jgi:type II secretory pathway predicted ATPase ExeA
MYRQRFALTHDPLPKNASGKTFFDSTPGYARLVRGFRQLLDDGGLGVLTADPGVGKTAAIRNLCNGLPRPDHLVLYLCDTAVSPLDLYRTLAVEMGVRPSHRRAQLWTDIKKALVHQVDERGTMPVLIIDEAQHLSDKFLIDLSGFLNFAFDSRDLLCMWLVGLPPLLRHLRMQQHAALYTRVAVQMHLEPLERDVFLAMIDHGLRTAGATRKLLSDSALEMLLRASRGVPRLAARLLRAALRRAIEQGQDFVDDPVLQAVLDEFVDGARP